MKTVEQTCWCGTVFLAKEADVKRGWGKACSKSHAAVSRERRLDRFDYKESSQKPDGSWVVVNGLGRNG